MTDLPEGYEAPSVGPPAPEGQNPVDFQEGAGFFDAMAAGWKRATILTDRWGYEGRLENDLALEMFGKLDADTQKSLTERATNGGLGQWETFNSAIVDEAARAADLAPDQWADYPLTVEDLKSRTQDRRRKEFDEAQAVLDLPGGGVPAFLGEGAAAMTDPVSLALLPLGAGGSIARVVASEALLGALGEAAVLPREFEVSRELDLPEPEVLPRLLGGGLFGGVIGGVVAGAPRAYSYYKTKRIASREAAKAGDDPLDHRDNVDAEYERMNGVETPAGRVGSQQSKPDLSYSDFDFSPSGNASPRTNRIGYVFGRLLALGYEPHIAAGLTGNLMQESGVAINTRAIGDNGNAFGMAQWNGPRRDAYLAFAKTRGKDPADLDTQIAFLDHELKNSESAAAAKILAAPDARTAARIASDSFWRPGIPHIDRRMAYADTVMQQYDLGAVPRWQGPLAQDAAFTGYTGTSRGYTGTGQTSTGTGRRIDVEYEVVDASLLKRAGGDLQPRDRSRAASNEQIAEIAAGLDPARLMPSPEADRGAPVVGPDNVIESGNGRVAAIERAAAEHPDRYEAYRTQIEAAGFEIPEGVERPVLIARRKTDLDDASRQAFVREANTSVVARMSATERSAADAADLDPDTVALFDPGERLGAPANRAFVKRVLSRLPQAERNALVDASGALNAEGVQRIRQALFARAYSAPDILARYTETDAGELRALMDALEKAAPEWAALRADVAAGRIRPEFDITDHLLGAMRFIATAREIAAREGTGAAQVVKDMLAEADLLNGAVNPLIAALVQKFLRNGRAESADKIGDFLTRYAAEARKVGTTDAGLLDAPGPADVLRAIDNRAFGDLPDDFGPATGLQEAALDVDLPDMGDTAFADGASSPEAIDADDVAAAALREDLGDGPFGPVVEGFEGDWRGAVSELQRRETGEVPGALRHPQIGPVALVWGKAPEGKRGQGFGLAKILNKHPEVLDDLQGRLEQATEVVSQTENRIRLRGEGGTFVISKDWRGDARAPWLLTAYETQRPVERSMGRSGDLAEGSSPPAPLPPKDSASAVADQEHRALRQQVEDWMAQDPDFRIDMPDGTTLSARELLDDMDRDGTLADVIDTCLLGGT